MVNVFFQMWAKVRQLGCVGRVNHELEECDIQSIADSFFHNLSPNQMGNFNFDNYIDNSNSFSFDTVAEYDIVIALNSI